MIGSSACKDTVTRVWRKVKSDWDAWNARSLAIPNPAGMPRHHRANSAAKEGRQRPADTAGVGPREIGRGDQRIGGAGAPLIGKHHLALASSEVTQHSGFQE